MGAGISQCLRECSPSVDGLGSDDLILRVVHAPIEDSSGAKLTGYKVGDELKIAQFHMTGASDTLSMRYRDKVKQQWPPSYRFQISKRCWHALVVPSSGWSSSEQACIMQMALSPDERTLEHVEIDVDDANVAASYASRFNRNQRQFAGSPEESGISDEMNSARPLVEEQRHQRIAGADEAPTVKVAATIACEVIVSSHPSMIPVGGFCTLAPYSDREVQKFVFDGTTEEFSEVPQAYFHYTAFASGGKEYVCDIQGVEEDDGSFLFVDPCLLRSGLPTVGQLVGAVANAQAQSGGSCARAQVQSVGPTVERFDTLHPKCGGACKVFDPHRRSGVRNGKVGLCGITCGLGR
jgi:hypothetical protein